MIIHKIKIFFLRIKWYLVIVSKAILHSKEVKNYEFLLNAKNKAHEKYLKLQRENPDNEDLFKLNIQIGLIDKILNYVRK